MHGTPVMSTPNRIPILPAASRSLASGSRIANSPEWGQLNTASSRPPVCASALCILSWIRVQHAHVEEPAADARLVGRNDHAKARVVEPRDRFQASWNGPPLFRRLDEVVAVVVDHAVAVEHDELDGPRGGNAFAGELDHVRVVSS
jgi:hypothetical protein